MAVFYIGTYDIVDPVEFQKYPPVVMALLPKYGAWSWRRTPRPLSWRARRAR